MSDFALSITVHTGQHGLETPMVGQAFYRKYKNQSVPVEMIQLTDNSSTILLYFQ